jgi:hypothetical protein
VSARRSVPVNQGEKTNGPIDLGWCRRQRIAAEFEIRKLRDLDVVFMILRAEASARRLSILLPAPRTP